MHRTGVIPLSVIKGGFYEKEIYLSYTGYHNHYHRNLVDMGEFIAKKEVLRRAVQTINSYLDNEQVQIFCIRKLEGV